MIRAEAVREHTPQRRVMRTAIDSRILPGYLAVRLLVVVHGDHPDNRNLNSHRRRDHSWLFSRWQRVGRYSRCTNLFGPFQAARRSICSLLKYPQKSLSRFRVGFVALLMSVAHDEQHARRMRQSAVKE